MKRKVSCIITLVILLSFIWLVSWIRNTSGIPYYTVDSYTELKKTLKNEKDIIIPDMRPELLESLTNYIVGLELKNHKNRTGYLIYGGAGLNGIDCFETFTITCTVISRVYNQRNPLERLNINMNLYGIDVECLNQDLTGKKEYQGERAYPPDSFVYYCCYQFDYLGCRYVVRKEILITPDQFAQKNSHTEVLRINDEAKSIIQSIVEKGSSVR